MELYKILRVKPLFIINKKKTNLFVGKLPKFPSNHKKLKLKRGSRRTHDTTLRRDATTSSVHLINNMKKNNTKTYRDTQVNNEELLFEHPVV